MVRFSPAGPQRQDARGADVALWSVPVQATLAFFFSALLATASANEAPGEGVGPWVQAGHAAVRLVVAGPAGAGPESAGSAAGWAGVEIRLEPGYRTYWRDPGEAGLPPTFDTSRSTNVAKVAVSYPVPHVFDEDGTTLFGYADDVLFPLAVTRTDPGRPAMLRLDLSFAVCATLCLPGRATAELALPDAPAPAGAALIAAARARVPRPQAVGAPGEPSILAVRSASPAALAVTARAAAPATLFAEGPEGWFLVPGPGQPGADGTMRFPLQVAQRPDGAAAGPVDLRLTLVSPAGAVESTARVDVGPAKP